MILLFWNGVIKKERAILNEEDLILRYLIIGPVRFLSLVIHQKWKITIPADLDVTVIPTVKDQELRLKELNKMNY